MKKNLFLKIFFGFFLFLLFPQEIFALEVSPPRQAVTISPGEEQVVRIRIENDTDTGKKYKYELSGFTVDPKTGAAKFNTKDNAAKWIKFNQNTFSLASNSARTSTFEISVPDDAKSGSHYISIFAKQVVPDSEISLSSRVGSLLFLYVGGVVKERLTLNNFSVSKRVNLDRPIKLNLGLENNGSIHLAPQGTILIDKGEEVVRKIKVNKEQNLLLPGESLSRQYNISSLSWTDSGKINAELVLQYGKSNKVLSGRDEFWYISRVLLYAAVVVLIAFMLFIYFLKIKHNSE